MLAVLVEQIKRNRHETGGLKHIPVPSSETYAGTESPLLRLRRLHVKVTL